MSSVTNGALGDPEEPPGRGGDCPTGRTMVPDGAHHTTKHKGVVARARSAHRDTGPRTGSSQPSSTTRLGPVPIVRSACKHGVTSFDVRLVLGDPSAVVTMSELTDAGFSDLKRPNIVVYAGYDTDGNPLVVFVDRFENVAFHSERGQRRSAGCSDSALHTAWPSRPAEGPCRDYRPGYPPRRRCPSDPFHDDGNTLAHAYAHGGQAVTPLSSLEFMDEAGEDAGS